MPDFGLTEALEAALKASREIPVMKPAEGELAAQAARAAPPAAAPVAPSPAPDLPVTDEDHLEPWQRARKIADQARGATTQAEVEACFRLAEGQNLSDEQVCTDSQNDEWEDLHSVLQDIWRKKAAA